MTSNINKALPFLLMLILINSLPAAAKNHAVLVAVSDYPNLSEENQLSGPLNDVQMLRNHLIEWQGYKDSEIIELSESPTANNSPSRKNILEALENLSESVNDNDFVFLHFGGHGSRQPAGADDKDELDGYDEIFLPKDAAKWNDYIGSVENAITDNEVHHLISSMLNKGADVWAVFDSCHSGTMTRGAGNPQIKMRKISELALGIPTVKSRGNPSASQTVETSLFSTPSQETSRRGKLIAFSAAQTTQTTPERRLPRYSDDAKFHGQFSYLMTSALAKNPGVTYRQLGQLIVEGYRAMPWYSSEPLISGEGLDSVVFGNENRGQRTFEAHIVKNTNQVKINAGELFGVGIGSQLALYKRPTLAEEDLLSRIVVDKATSIDSHATIAEATQSNQWPKRMFAKLETPSVKAKVNVSTLKTKSLSKMNYQSLLESTKEAAKINPIIDYSTPDKAEWLVTQFENKIWFLRPDQTLPCEQIEDTRQDDEYIKCQKNRKQQQILNISLDGKSIKSVVNQGLSTLAKGSTLSAISSSLSGANNELEIDFTITRNGKQLSIPSGRTPDIRPGDEASFKVKNISGKPRDITILFKDGQYGITQIYPEPGQSNRLEDGKSVLPVLEWTFTNDTVGNEDIIVISLPSEAGLTTDFKFLEQPPLQVMSRGRAPEDIKKFKESNSAQHPLKTLMNEALLGENSRKRGLSKKANRDHRRVQDGGFVVYSWSIHD